MIVGESLALSGEQACVSGQAWTSDRIRFDVLHPGDSDARDGNASSCVIRVSAGPHTLLLTGDIEAASESDLVRNRAPLAADIVVVPHHGSLTSSTVPFIDSVHPDFALISAGYGNRWGFPREPVVERWDAMGAEVLNTATSGALYFRVCADEGVNRMQRERDRRHRFWHAET